MEDFGLYQLKGDECGKPWCWTCGVGYEETYWQREESDYEEVYWQRKESECRAEEDHFNATRDPLLAATRPHP